MSRQSLTVRAVTLALAALWVVIPAGPAAVGQEKKEPAKLSTIEKLGLLIDTKDFAGPMPLKDFLGRIYKKCADQGVELPILVDVMGFREADESQPNGPSDDEVSLPAVPRKITVSEALRKAVSQIKNQNGTIIVQNGRIWILTDDRATVDVRLAERVVAHFDKTPFADVVKRLADLAGTTIMIDPRADEKAKTPITVDLNGDCSIGAVLPIIADMAGLRVVRMGNISPRNPRNPNRPPQAAAKADLSVVGLNATSATRQPPPPPGEGGPANLVGMNRCVYITTPANADVLEKRIRAADAEHNEVMRGLMGGQVPGAPAPAPAGVGVPPQSAPAKSATPNLAQLQAEIAMLRAEITRLRQLVTPPKKER